MTSTFNETEDQVHLRVVKWLRLVLPNQHLLHHSPNEGNRHINFKTKLRRMGTQSGWPDLELFVNDGWFLPGVDWAPIFIELKRTKGGRLSDNQKALAEQFWALDYYWFCCNSARSVRAELIKLIELNESAESDALLEPEAKSKR